MVAVAEKSVKSQVRKPASLPEVRRVDRRLSAETVAEQGSVLKVLRQHGVTMRPSGTNQHSQRDS
jgi:hypothetical protein